MSEEKVVEVQTEETPSQGESANFEVEEEARAQGWVPEDEFRGDTSDWIDAETFVKRGKEINPILRKNNERIQKELDLTKKQMAELKAATEEFKKFQKEAYERKLHEFEEQINELKELKKRAVSESDGDLVVQIDDKIDAIRAQKEAAKVTKDTSKKEEEDLPAVNPEIQRDVENWMDNNKWYKTDSKLRAAADAIATQVRDEHPYLVGREFFNEVDKALEATFSPEKLGKKSRPRGMVDSGGRANTGSASKKSYDNLPPEAKQACDKFVKQKLMSREEYVNSYDWS